MFRDRSVKLEAGGLNKALLSEHVLLIIIKIDKKELKQDTMMLTGYYKTTNAIKQQLVDLELDKGLTSHYLLKILFSALGKPLSTFDGKFLPLQTELFTLSSLTPSLQIENVLT